MRASSLAERRARLRMYKHLGIYLLVVAIAVVLLWRIYDRTTDQLRHQQDMIEQQQEDLERGVHERCLLSNRGRAEINRRGEITKEFLTTAADARRATALGSKEPWERVANSKTSVRYRQLAKQIVPLEYLDCNDDGKPDEP